MIVTPSVALPAGTQLDLRVDAFEGPSRIGINSRTTCPNIGLRCRRAGHSHGGQARGDARQSGAHALRAANGWEPLHPPMACMAQDDGLNWRTRAAPGSTAPTTALPGTVGKVAPDNK